MSTSLTAALEAIEAEQYEKAVSLLKDDKDDVFLLFHKGRALVYLEKYTEATECFIRVSKLGWQEMHYENNPFVYLGFIKFRQGSYGDAIKHFQEAKYEQNLPDALKDYRPYRWAGICHHLLGQLQRAAQEYAVSAVMFSHLDSQSKIIGTDDHLFEYCRSLIPLKLDMLEILPLFIDLKAPEPQ